MVHNNNDRLDYPVPDSTELIIQQAIEGIQKMIRPYESKEDETLQVAAIEINPAMRKHWETEIKILRDAPRNPDKLRVLLKIKQRQYVKSKLAEEIQPLVTEIEMLQFVLFLVSRNEKHIATESHSIVY